MTEIFIGANNKEEPDDDDDDDDDESDGECVRLTAETDKNCSCAKKKQ